MKIKMALLMQGLNVAPAAFIASVSAFTSLRGLSTAHCKQIAEKLEVTNRMVAIRRAGGRSRVQRGGKKQQDSSVPCGSAQHRRVFVKLAELLYAGIV